MTIDKKTCECTDGRRNFLRAAAGAAGLTVLGRTHSAGQTEALLLSCMDYRLMDDVEKYMAGRGLRDKYDHIILAGASLGATTDKFPAWKQTFWEHLEVAIKLHAIKTVVVLDHRDCGAYKVVLGAESVKEPPAEIAAHRKHLALLRQEIGKKYPALKVETAIMSLDGKVEAL